MPGFGVCLGVKAKGRSAESQRLHRHTSIIIPNAQHLIASLRQLLSNLQIIQAARGSYHIKEEMMRKRKVTLKEELV